MNKTLVIHAKCRSLYERNTLKRTGAARSTKARKTNLQVADRALRSHSQFISRKDRTFFNIFLEIFSIGKLSKIVKIRIGKYRLLIADIFVQRVHNWSAVYPRILCKIRDLNISQGDSKSLLEISQWNDHSWWRHLIRRNRGRLIVWQKIGIRQKLKLHERVYWIC